MIELTLLTRTGCHLCDTMKTVVEQVRLQYPLVLNEIDISTRPDLEREFGNDIPVLLCGDRILARHRISASQLVSALSVSSGPVGDTKKFG